MQARLTVVGIIYIGHSAFLIRTSQGEILIDPFLTGNVSAVVPDDLDPDLILVTHAHSDHLGDAIEISKKFEVPILTTYEVANFCISKGAKAIDAHIGGKLAFPFCTVKLFPAVHSSSADDVSSVGVPCSFVVVAEGKSIFHAGDTALFGDMKLIGEDSPLDVALLPIDGCYTMGIDDAVKAVKLLKSKIVVPMHYGDSGSAKADPYDFCKKVKVQTKRMCVILRPGETLTID